jgi:AraC family transcriptional regulator
MSRDIQKSSEYTSRINRIFDYIDCNLAKQMTLEELASVANFSKYHFNRIFRSFTGETPFSFIQRLRVQRAASLILAHNNITLTDIALQCGFTDISIFSRCFKKHFGISASEYRDTKTANSNIDQTDSNNVQYLSAPEPYLCPELQIIKWRSDMELNKGVEVKILPKTTVAYVRNLGAYDGNQDMFQQLRNKLFTWAGAHGLINGGNFRFLVMYHDNPNSAVNNNLRMSLCIVVPPDTKTDGEIGKMVIEESRYAVARCELTGADFQKAWDWTYGVWLPSSGYMPDDKPCFEEYLGAPVDGNYVIDICIPVKEI